MLKRRKLFSRKEVERMEFKKKRPSRGLEADVDAHNSVFPSSSESIPIGIFCRKL